MLSPEQQKRFDELQALMKEKKYFGLSQDEKAEYKELKEGSVGTTKASTLAAKPKAATPETVELPVSQVQALLARLEKLETASSAGNLDIDRNVWKPKEERKKDKKIFLKLYTPEGSNDQFPVIARRQTVYRRMETAKGKELIPFTGVTLLYPDDQTEEVEMPLLEYAKITNRVFADVVEEHVEKLEMKTGKTTKRKIYDYDNYRSLPAGQVPQFVEAETRKFEIKLPDGRTITVRENVINAS